MKMESRLKVPRSTSDFTSPRTADRVPPPSTRGSAGKKQVQGILSTKDQKNPQVQNRTKNVRQPHTEKMRPIFKSNVGGNLNRVGNSKTLTEKKIKFTINPDSQATTQRRQNAQPSPPDTTQKKPSRTADKEAEPEMNEKELKYLETQFRTKKKILYSSNIKFSKEMDEVKKFHSSLVKLHKRVLNSTGNDLGPIEGMRVDYFRPGNAVQTTADLQHSSEHQDEGEMEDSMSAGLNSDELENTSLSQELQPITAELKNDQDEDSMMRHQKDALHNKQERGSKDCVKDDYSQLLKQQQADISDHHQQLVDLKASVCEDKDAYVKLFETVQTRQDKQDNKISTLKTMLEETLNEHAKEIKKMAAEVDQSSMSCSTAEGKKKKKKKSKNY